jgi:DNA-directed RNA polymerase subunit RPC12/RpoP
MAKKEKEKEKQPNIKCPQCSGKGFQEEKTKGYRRYKCWSCKGTKEIPYPHKEKK